jgi:hypothetical protein
MAETELDRRSPSPSASSRRSSLILPDVNAALQRSETFLICKYPPSTSNHPLNCQINLVNHRNATNHENASQTSIASSGFHAVANAQLQRTASIRSNRSNASNGSSSSGLGSNRKTTPLYNLEFHKFRETVVLDAGTDAKIARFLKK